MGIEIERKFLLLNNDWKDNIANSKFISQGYVNDPANGDKSIVRIRVKEDTGYITIKSQNPGLSREEYEYEIPVNDAKGLLKNCSSVIKKIRHEVMYEGKKFEVDEFLGENNGLLVAEIELNSENEIFKKPSWLGEEVTHDKKYYNASLISKPYNKWQKMN